MTYKEAQQDLRQRHLFGIKLGLDNMRIMLKRLGNPEREYKTIHIAGTNGKGSTAAMLASILTSNDHKTGLYTSPHITSVRERFTIDRRMISTRDFARLYQRILEVGEGLNITYFESTTLLAFLYFADKSVDIAVIETGLGGRFDATNVIIPVCSVITSIAMDHQEHLGNTIEAIAGEKAGIIKAGVPLVLAKGEQKSRKILIERALELNSEVTDADKMVKISGVKVTSSHIFFKALAGREFRNEIKIPLSGRHQVENARTALAAAFLLENLTDKVPLYCAKIKDGFSKVSWPARFELLRKNPRFIVDVSHNEAGFEALRKNIEDVFPGEMVILVLGMKEEKEWQSSLDQLRPLLKRIVSVPVPGAGAIQNALLKSYFKRIDIPFESCRSVRQGVLKASKIAGKKGIVIAAGSHFTVSSIKKSVKLLD